MRTPYLPVIVLWIVTLAACNDDTGSTAVSPTADMAIAGMPMDSISDSAGQESMPYTGVIGNDDDDVVWDRHTAKQVAVAGGFVVSDFDDDDDVDTPRYRADHDYTEDSSDLDGLPDEGPDHDSDAEVELEDLYITLDSGDDHDKIFGKKLERKKARAEKRNKNKGMLADAAGGNEGDDEEELPEEMKFPGGERRGRLLRYLPGNSSLTQMIK